MRFSKGLEHLIHVDDGVRYKVVDKSFSWQHLDFTASPGIIRRYKPDDALTDALFSECSLVFPVSRVPCYITYFRGILIKNKPF
jgi:hypothetical protein